MIKKAGIVADNYKVEKFKEKLIEKGFTDFKVAPFKGETSTIQVMIPEEKIGEIKNICAFVELFFKTNPN